uniref:Uncharacterized protein n=1 Tax=Tetranychus urticae TaxID=32264 RepID=T1K5Y3_TETUR
MDPIQSSNFVGRKNNKNENKNIFYTCGYITDQILFRGLSKNRDKSFFNMPDHILTHPQHVNIIKQTVNSKG